MAEREVVLATIDLDELNSLIPGEWSAIVEFSAVWDSIGGELVVSAQVEFVASGED